ncbi:MAG: ATP-binding cassette domain-containing protein [Planctomycetaceae bacterium]|nr:ATP-binding cassette domain-containing protein [Planctomycetaceae bacterium]
MSATIELRGLWRSFEEGGARRDVLSGVDLEVPAGSSVALLGRSGSGKSTLLHLVGGLDRPDRGEVWVEGRRVDLMGERERTLARRRRVGFVFQSFDLLPTLTVLENVLLPMELERRTGRAERDRAMALLARVGLADRAAAFPDRLSGGEQQRIALARALVHEPAVVLADEPTGNLDGDNAARVLDLLGSLVAERGTTLLVATHSREAALRQSRAFELADGRLVPLELAPGVGRG